MVTVTIDREALESLVGATERRHDSDDCAPAESRRLREVLRVARAALAAVPRPVEGCVVGGCTAVGPVRWPTLDGGTVAVCEWHHDLAAQHVERSEVDDEEALWRAREGR